MRSNVGGPPGTSSAAVVSTDGFRNRVPGQGRGRSGQMRPETEKAIESGLVFLQRHQSENGSWSMVGPYSDGGMSKNDTAATAMALLALLVR